MNTGITTSVPIQWMPATTLVLFKIAVTSGEPLPGAVICFGTQNALFEDDAA